MSRSDTFDSDIVEVEAATEEVKSLPWISSPVLQNTTNSTCEALLDPRKLLCESSSIFALIPCRPFAKKVDSSKNKNSDLPETHVKKASGGDVGGVSSSISDTVSKKVTLVEPETNLQPTDMLSDVPNVSTPLLSCDVLKSKSQVPNLEQSTSYPVIGGDETIQPIPVSDNPDAGLPAWCFEGDDSFKDVIEAINRLCDTISSGRSNISGNSEESSFVEIATREDERITEQPKHKESPIDIVYNSSQSGTSTSEVYYPCVGSPLQTSPDSVSTPGGVTEEAVLPDSSVADSSSPAVIEDDSSTNQTDILQYSMCSSSLLNDDSGLYLSPDGNIPNPEEAPPPGHVAAMRIKFETITSINVNTVKMLKRSDDDT